MKRNCPSAASGGVAFLASGRFGGRIAFGPPDRPGTGQVNEVMREFQALNQDVRTELKRRDSGFLDLQAGLDEMNQRLAALQMNGLGASHKNASPGEQFTRNPELKSFADYRSRPGRLSMELKANLTTAPNSAGALSPAEQDNWMPILPRRRMTVRNLLTVLQVSSGSVEYPKQTERTLAAGMVAEGADKPESALVFDLVSVPIRTIAHWLPASRQILDDVPQLKNFIDVELIYGLALKEEEQLLSGDGSGQNLRGLVPVSTAFSAPFTITSPTMLDTIGLALLQCAQALYPPDGIVMNEADWWRIRLLKDAHGEYIMGPPGSDVEPRLFGLPVVPTPALQADKFLLGSFRAAGTLYDRWTPRIEVSTDHADFFTKNLVAILAEERIGLAIKHPGALIYGAFGNA